MTERSTWQKAVRSNTFGLNRLWSYSDKSASATKSPSTKVGSEAFWPTSIDKESQKAAQILRGFCRDGIYEEASSRAQDTSKPRHKTIKKIPAELVKNARGLAIFTGLRSGLWFSGAGGSGILVARLPDGNWSPPSGILLHTAAGGFLVGVDIYDCVLVLNTQAAVEAFSKWRITLGGAFSAVAGPMSIGGLMESGVESKQVAIYSYIRSRGCYASAVTDGTVVMERTDENERYYRHRYSANEILTGKVSQPPPELKSLWQTLKTAQGDLDVDYGAIPTEPSPSDLEVYRSDAVFGVPDREDPDPFGVLALEKEGLQIREAGTKTAASPETFEFRPSPSSPIFDAYNSKSFEKRRSGSRRSSYRNSTVTINSIERRYTTTDISTQTDVDGSRTRGSLEFARALNMDINNLPSTPSGLTSSGSRPSSQFFPRSSIPKLPDTPEETVPATPNEDATDDQQDIVVTAASPQESTMIQEPIRGLRLGSELSNNQSQPIVLEDNTNKPQISSGQDESGAGSNDHEADADLSDDDDDDDDDDEEPIIIEEVQQAARPQVIFKPRVVSIPKHMRPELPTRNPSRMRPTSIPTATIPESPAMDQASTTSVRSSSISLDGHQRHDSVTSIASSQQRSPSSGSLKSGAFDDKDEEGHVLALSPQIDSCKIDNNAVSTLDAETCSVQIPTSPKQRPPNQAAPPTREAISSPEGNQPPAAPRISLLSMKLSLSDEDDDDDGADNSPTAQTHTPVAMSPRKVRLDSLDYNYHKR